MNGTVVYAVKTGAFVTAAVRVDEGPPRGQVEYIATVPALDSAGATLPAAQVKASLVAAWQQQRASGPTPPTDLTGTLGGPVTL